MPCSQKSIKTNEFLSSFGDRGAAIGGYAHELKYDPNLETVAGQNVHLTIQTCDTLRTWQLMGFATSTPPMFIITAKRVAIRVKE